MSVRTGLMDSFDTSYVKRDSSAIDTYLIDETYSWNEKAVEVIPATATNIERLEVLADEMHATSIRLFVYNVLLMASLVAMSATEYWIIPFAIFLPLFLRYAGHYATLLIAIKRARNAKWRKGK